MISCQSRLAAALAALTLALAAPQVAAQGTNLNDLVSGGGAAASGGGGAAARPTVAGIPTDGPVLFAQPAASPTGFESDVTWFAVNNTPVNFPPKIKMPPEAISQKGELMVIVQDVRWFSGTTMVEKADGTGQRAGDQHYFPDLPAFAVVVLVVGTKKVYSVNSSDPKQPNLIPMEGTDVIVIAVNDLLPTKEEGDNWADNGGAFDFLILKQTARQ